jgi:hypothetical protein
MLARAARSSSSTLAPRIAGALAGSSRTVVTGTAFDPREKAIEVMNKKGIAWGKEHKAAVALCGVVAFVLGRSANALVPGHTWP